MLEISAKLKSSRIHLNKHIFIILYVNKLMLFKTQFNDEVGFEVLAYYAFITK